eukprot:940243-Pleurochrysis_carterae.AAC.1
MIWSSEITQLAEMRVWLHLALLFFSKGQFVTFLIATGLMMEGTGHLELGIRAERGESAGGSQLLSGRLCPRWCSVSDETAVRGHTMREAGLRPSLGEQGAHTMDADFSCEMRRIDAGCSRCPVRVWSCEKQLLASSRTNASKDLNRSGPQIERA